MTHQTKLVDCGSTVFVYDFKNKKNVKRLGFEKDVIQGNITNLKRLLLTNFVNGQCLIGFNLKIALNEYEYIKEKLNHFTKRIKVASGQSEMKYLAVVDFHSKEEATHATIRLITDIEIYILTRTLEKQLANDCKRIWGDEVLIIEHVISGNLIETFSLAYSNSLQSNSDLKRYGVLFQDQLQYPLILHNEKANTFIKKQKLLDYPIYRSKEIYDGIGGFVIVNEYSLVDTTPSETEAEIFIT